MTRRENSGKFVAFSLLVAMLAPSGCVTESDQGLFDELLTLAKQGNPEAQYHVGMMLNNGLGTAKDPRTAFEWFQRGAAAGNPLAAYKMGCYFGGQFQGVVSVDQEKSFDYKLVAANAGYSMAQYDVGSKFYEFGKYEEALLWWKLSADQGLGEALLALSVLYQQGKVVPQNASLAYAYFRLSGAGSAGHVADEPGGVTLEQLKSSLSEAQLKNAEEMVASWRPKPTELTMKAFNGIAEARQLVGQ